MHITNNSKFKALFVNRAASVMCQMTEDSNVENKFCLNTALRIQATDIPLDRLASLSASLYA